MPYGVTSGDTIVAIATPTGRGGIGVVRVSGKNVDAIALAIIGELPPSRYAALRNFVDGDGSVIDSGIALYFPGPHSFTGEDVLEFQGHGGPVVLDMLLNRIVSLGARIARPGEFSERAFLNDKIDLSQAEAIADLIDSVSQQAAKGAMRSLQGAFSKRIQSISELTINLRMYIEAAIDFPEEEIDFLADEKIGTALSEISESLTNTIKEAGQGALLREGISLVIAGRPNAGKSSLMNCLTGTDSSIVTKIPGTTRDIVSEHIHIDGIPLKLIDTAGIRVTEDEIEIEGVKRALREAEKADQVLVVVDLTLHAEDWRDHVAQLSSELKKNEGVTVVLNKTDLVPTTLEVAENVIPVSAKTGEGIERLKDHIKQLAGYDQGGEGSFIARRRHLDALERAKAHLIEGQAQLENRQAGELLAEELRLCHEALMDITGEFTSDDLLGKIFSSFCIGK